MVSLAEYLRASDIRQAQFAKQVGISRSYMSEIVSVERTPSLSVALEIHSQSGGSVDLSSLVSVSQRPSVEASS